MKERVIFNFKMDISKINIPLKLNNPFGTYVPEIASVAAKEFQEFISIEAKNWNSNFDIDKGKMFGVLVVETSQNSYSYLGTVSGKLPNNAKCNQFIPSVFDESIGDYFINKGMTELTEIGTIIKNTTDQVEITLLKEKRTQKSKGLQKRLFENYNFLNIFGKEKNLLEIFNDSSHGKPPAAAGECAAPKLLQYAIKQGLRPIALTEFWWGNSAKLKKKKHGVFYPACKDRCRPVLEYMLQDTKLFTNREKRD
jgi:tRNA pseudouridine32 synthase / 23S rRNA pseudouridine746 synthase